MKATGALTVTTRTIESRATELTGARQATELTLTIEATGPIESTDTELTGARQDTQVTGDSYGSQAGQRGQPSSE